MSKTPPKTPPKKKNQKKKKIKFIIDLSNNKLPPLNSINYLNNRNKPPLELSNKNLNLFKNINEKNLNSKKNPINMRLDEIIDKIKKERAELAENIKKQELEKLTVGLDNVENNNTEKNKKREPNLNNEINKNLKNLIKDIEKDFDLFFSENKKENKKKMEFINPLFGNKNNLIIGHSDNIFDFFKKPLLDKPPLFPPPLPPSRPPPPPIKHVTIEEEINSLSDLLQLIEKYPLTPGVKYNINMESIHKIKTPLNELNSMIGMNELKNNIVDQVIYFMQDLHLTKSKNEDFMHTVIYGPPGSGKTEIAKIIGKIFCNMGLLKNNTFKKATRTDLIAGYLGQTAIKTRGVVQECLGGVLFIDEAYALGNVEKRDSFAKECIDTLCESLSDNKSNLMVIIAGYEEDLNKCFFSYNQGLNSRFPWRFKTDDYSAGDLNLIFQKKVKDAGWSFLEELNDSWFEEQKEYFKYFGRDMETLFSKTKIAHSRRVFCKPADMKKKLTIKDLNKGFDMFISNNEVKSRTEKNKYIPEFMYV